MRTSHLANEASDARAEQQGIGFYRIENKRKRQQDHISIRILNNEHYTHEQWREAQANAVAAMQVASLTHNFPGGSTLCSVIIDGSTLYVTNIGDSSACLVILDENKQPLPLRITSDNDIVIDDRPLEENKLLRLHKLHRPEIAVTADTAFSEENSVKYPESYDIKRAGGMVVYKGGALRTSGTVTVSRSLGDCGVINKFNHPSAAKFHTPDIHQYKIRWPQNHQYEAFIIVGSDGLFDKLLPSVPAKAPAIAYVIAKERNKNSSVKDMAGALVQSAVDSGAADNISAIVVHVHPGMSIVRGVMVADGHCINQHAAVAEYAAEHYLDEVTDNLRKIFRNKIHAISLRFFEGLNVLLETDLAYLKDSASANFIKSLLAVINSNLSSHERRCLLLALHAQYAGKDEEVIKCLLPKIKERYEPIFTLLKILDWQDAEYSKIPYVMARLVEDSPRFYEKFLLEVMMLENKILKGENQELREHNTQLQKELRSVMRAAKGMMTYNPLLFPALNDAQAATAEELPLPSPGPLPQSRPGK